LLGQVINLPQQSWEEKKIMPLLPRLSSLWHNLFRKARRDQELTAELDVYLEMLVEQKINEGLAPEEARRAALVELGGKEQVKEQVREVSMGHQIETFWQDLRYALRMLRRNPGLTAVAALSLALSIGANTAIFSLLDTALLKMLPVKDPQELVLFKWLSTDKLMWRSHDGSGIESDEATGMKTGTSFSYPAFEQFRDQNQTLAGVFAFALLRQLNVSVDGRAEIAEGQIVSGGYHTGLGVTAFLGRTLTGEDDSVGAAAAAVISHRYWQRRFNSDPSVIGKIISLNGAAFTIVGVTRPEFFGALEIDRAPDITVPMVFQPQVRPTSSQLLSDAQNWWLHVMGRLKPGMDERQALADLDLILQQHAVAARSSLQADYDLPRLSLAPGGQGLTQTRSRYARPLVILMAAAGLALLIACLNMANLLLVRAATRRKEIAVRLSLGASRFRLVRQLLTESLLLALIGGALGLFSAYWGKDALLALRAWGRGGMALDLNLDLRALAFTAAMSVLTGILFGLAPALRATRVDLTTELKDGAGRTASARSRLAKGLVVAQVSLSLLLLIGAGLFVRTLRNLAQIDLGFNRENLLIFRVNPGASGYKGERLTNLYQQMLERIGALPGVRSATLLQNTLLGSGVGGGSIYAQGYDSQPNEKLIADTQHVAPNFFDTMEIPILKGRRFTPQENEQAPKVAVINQALARRYFAGRDPIGQHLSIGAINYDKSGKMIGSDNPPIEIVGLARDSKYNTLRGEIQPCVYLPYRQRQYGISAEMTCAVRTAGDPAAMTVAIRNALQSIDANAPLFGVKTQNGQIAEQMAQPRLFASLSSFFGLLAMALAGIGLYGVMSYTVARRTHEIGIRMALGAKGSDVLRMVMRETTLLVVIGLVIGLAAAFARTRLIESLLFWLTATDTLTIALGALLLLAVAALAGWLPARRAARVDPMVALRYE
jgi:predicted permease